MKSYPILLSALFASSFSVFGGTVEPPVTVAPAPSPWTCRISLYGWAEGMDGDVGIRGVTAPVDVDFDDILGDLDFAIMGTVEIGYGRWSFIADNVFADLGDSQTGPLNGTVHVGLEQYLGNFFVAYEAVKTDSLKFDVYGGARVNYLDADFSYKGPGGFHFGISGDKGWVDPVIGARCQVQLPHNFFFRALGDVGGFGVSSDFTWQALAGFGYSITEHSSVLLGYRALGTDYTDGGFTYDVTASGLILGYQYTF